MKDNDFRKKAEKWAEQELAKHNIPPKKDDYGQLFSKSAFLDQAVFGTTAYRLDEDGKFSRWLSFEEILKLPINDTVSENLSSAKIIERFKDVLTPEETDKIYEQRRNR